MSAGGYSCSKCGKTGASAGNCCGRPMDEHRTVQGVASNKGNAMRGREARVQARRGKK